MTTVQAKPEGRSPNPIDVHVGTRLRARRKALGMSQEQLAEGLGLTFQQVQKYERGANRVSASKMYEAAKVLGVAPGFFFEGLEETADGKVSTGLDTLLTAGGGIALANAFLDLSQPHRQAVVDLARSLAGKPDKAIAA